MCKDWYSFHNRYLPHPQFCGVGLLDTRCYYKVSFWALLKNMDCSSVKKQVEKNYSEYKNNSNVLEDYLPRYVYLVGTLFFVALFFCYFFNTCACAVFFLISCSFQVPASATKPSPQTVFSQFFKLQVTSNHNKQTNCLKAM